MLKRCDVHGVEYQSTVNGRETGVCPECAAEMLSDYHKRARAEEAQARHVDEVARKRDEQAKRFDRVGIPPRFRNRTFANYQVGNDEQGAVLSRVKRYSASLVGGGCGSLLMRGDVGTGKTHLACAVGMEYESSGRSVLFMTVIEMIRNIREAYGQGDESLQQRINFFRDVDLLILDEVGFQSGTADELLLLTDVMNARYGWMKPTVLLTNLSVDRVAEVVGDRVMDRLSEDGGALLNLDWGSFRGQAAGFHQRAKGG